MQAPGEGAPFFRDPQPALDHADRLIRGADPDTAGLWSRTAARLIRVALERALDRYWSGRRPDVAACTITAQLLMLRSTIDRSDAQKAYLVWSLLSSATHPHAYELAPTAGELRRWHVEVSQFVSQLGS